MEACALPKKMVSPVAPDASNHVLCNVVLPVWVEQLRLAQSGSEKAVFDMMKAFSSLMTPSPEGDQVEGLTVPPELVDQMYRGFQYQDSLSQILAILIRDMERMQQTLESPAGHTDTTAPGAWMERLQSEFVMQAQRGAGHRDSAFASGSGAASGLGNGSHGADDLTFF